MKNYILIFLLLFCHACFSQTLIHSHNDYEKPAPLINALENKAYNVEADVYLVDGKLLVSHEKKDIKTERTLLSLYIQPIVQLYEKNKGFISKDKQYKPNLVIDIKENGETIISELVSLLKPYQKYFDRSLNPNAVQIVLSGDRGAISKWKSYPSLINFDGRPYEQYDAAALARVAFISDSYSKYINRQNPTATDSLSAVVTKAHQVKKPVRFWGAPDNEETWKKLIELTVDILNTDKVTECRHFLSGH